MQFYGKKQAECRIQIKGRYSDQPKPGGSEGVIRDAHIIRADGYGGTQRVLHNHLAVTEGSRFDHLTIGTADALPAVRSAYEAHGRLLLPQRYKYPRDGIERPGEEIRDILRREKADVFMTWQHPAHVIGGRASAALDKPALVYEHSAPDYSSDLAAREMQYMIDASHRGEFNRILYVSHYAQKTHEDVGVNPRGAEVVPIGIDLNRFKRDEEKRQQIRRELGLSDSDTLIGVVTQDRPEKDFPATLEVATRLIDTSRRESQSIPHFAICGMHFGADNQALVDELERRNIAQYVHLQGLVEDMPGMYSAMDINLLTSQSETFGLTSVEAMACGVPFAGTLVGEHEQIVGTTGVLLPTRDKRPLHEWRGADDFVDALQTMRVRLSNPDERDKITKAVTDRAQRYDRTTLALGEIVVVEFHRGKNQRL